MEGVTLADFMSHQYENARQFYEKLREVEDRVSWVSDTASDRLASVEQKIAYRDDKVLYDGAYVKSQKRFEVENKLLIMRFHVHKIAEELASMRPIDFESLDMRLKECIDSLRFMVKEYNALKEEERKASEGLK